METHIQSNKQLEGIRSVRQGSEDYNASIGLLRIIFGISDDPIEVLTLRYKDKIEVWGMYDNVWRSLFGC
jgi:hypothetical protein